MALRFSAGFGAFLALAVSVFGPGIRAQTPAVDLDQGWSPQEQGTWYDATQGSRLIPLEWLKALEQRLATSLGAERAVKSVNEYRTPAALAVGTTEQVVEKLRAAAGRGLGYAIHYFPEAAYDRSGIELFEREVIPALG